MNKLLAIGSLPPPYNGMSVFFEGFCQSRITSDFTTVCMDIADRRALSNVGKFDLVNTWLALRHGLKFLILLLRFRPDIVYLPIAQGTPGFLRDSLFLVPCRILRIPVVIHLHGSEFDRFYCHSNWLLRRLIRFSLKTVSFAIVLGEGIRGVFGEILDQTRIRVIPNFSPLGIELSSPEVCVDESEVKILFLGSLKRRKGFLDVIRAIPTVYASIPSTRFIFAGEICEIDTYHKAVEFLEDHHLDQCVEFKGPVYGKEKVDLYCSSDIFCFVPIEPEGQPLVILEAMSCGLPVISTDTGAISDMVIEGRTGFLVDPDSPDQIADAILRLTQNKDLRYRLGTQSKEHVSETFSLEVWENAMIRLFRDCIGSSI